MKFIVEFVCLCISFVTAQFPTAPPIRPAGYICVPQGTCIGGGTGPGGIEIDPRIVTQPGGGVPGGNCPSGQVACSQQSGGSTQCGNRHTTSTNIGAGNSMYGSFPWQASLWRFGTYIGSGVLIDEWHVLTAAHKVNSDALLSPSNIQVYMGVWDPTLRDSDSQRRTAVSISSAIGFNNDTLINDIAIIRLNNCIGLGYQINVGKICMPTAAQAFTGSCIVSGWGQTSFGSNDAPTNQQKQVNVNIVDMTSCRQMLSNPNVLGTSVDRYLDQVGEICAGAVEGRDACTQDGGAPLVCPGNQGFVLAGLVIWGKGCGRANVPGVYVRVANYSPWIDRTVAQLNMQFGAICSPR